MIGLKMIGESIGPYKVLSHLGGGGMGVVYRAEDSRLGRTVALKFLPDTYERNPQALERFDREARAVSSLNHPHICTVFDVGEWQSRPYIVMELLEGRGLDQALGSGSFSVDEVIEIGIQIADALDAAHQKGVLHRDIKPANIIVSPRGHATLLDFGLAKMVGDPGDTSGESTAADLTLTRPGTTLGTIAYMSPEQVRGEEVDARTDIFSFGAVLYEMVTGQPAFKGPTSGLIFDAVLNRQPPPVAVVKPDAPAGLASLVDRSIEKDRGMRLQTAADMRAELKRIRRTSYTQVAVPLASAPPPAAPSPPVAEPKTGEPPPAPAPRDMTKHVRILGWIYIVWGGLRMVSGILGSQFLVMRPFLQSLPLMSVDEPDGFLWMWLSGVAMVAVGYGLWRRFPRSRGFALVVGFFLLAMPVVGWVVAVYAAWVLVSKGGKALFRRTA